MIASARARRMYSGVATSGSPETSRMTPGRLRPTGRREWSRMRWTAAEGRNIGVAPFDRGARGEGRKARGAGREVSGGIGGRAAPAFGVVGHQGELRADMVVAVHQGAVSCR